MLNQILKMIYGWIQMGLMVIQTGIIWIGLGIIGKVKSSGYIITN